MEKLGDESGEQDIEVQWKHFKTKITEVTEEVLG